MSAQNITIQLPAFEQWLANAEKSPATIRKYLCDVRRFASYAGSQPLTRTLVLRYKEALGARYAASSANTMLAALNAFFHFAGQLELCVRQFKVQRQAYVPAQRELSRAEYERLMQAAQCSGRPRLALILQTICATGIRVSELQHITVQAVERGEATVRCKGKTRTILLVHGLRRMLRAYARAHGIVRGPIFITKSRTPVSRTAIWRDMKALCQQAHVQPEKVFPHNLRHLFARTFYAAARDIAKLADVLGHASINTTRIYLATTCAEHRRNMERLSLLPLQQKKPHLRR